MWDALAWRKNCWLSPLLLPSPTSPDPGNGVNRSKINFFQNSINTNQQRHLYQDPGIFCQGDPGTSTYFTVYRGGPMVLLHIFQGGGSNFLQGGGRGPNANSYRNPYNYNLWFSRGFWTPYRPSGSAHGQCGILAWIGSDEPVRPPFKLWNSKC